MTYFLKYYSNCFVENRRRKRQGDQLRSYYNNPAEADCGFDQSSGSGGGDKRSDVGLFYFILLIFLFFFFLERGEGREKDKDRNINVREKHQSVAS